MADAPRPPNTRLDDATLEVRLEALDRTLGALEVLEGVPGELGRDAVSALCEIYGEALARLVDVAANGPGGEARAECLARDPLVGHLLALYGLHPEPVASRVDRALAQLDGGLFGATAELAGLDGGVANVVVRGAGGRAEELCGSVREALLGEVPELREVEATPAMTATFIPVESLRARRR